jgi:hypothetical protein
MSCIIIVLRISSLQIGSATTVYCSIWLKHAQLEARQNTHPNFLQVSHLNLLKHNGYCMRHLLKLFFVLCREFIYGFRVNLIISNGYFLERINQLVSKDICFLVNNAV